MNKPTKITLQTVMLHISDMKQGFLNELKDTKKELSEKIEGVEKRLTKSIDTLGNNLQRQIQGIDERLDDIEKEKLPEKVLALQRRFPKRR